MSGTGYLVVSTCVNTKDNFVEKREATYKGREEFTVN